MTRRRFRGGLAGATNRETRIMTWVDNTSVSNLLCPGWCEQVHATDEIVQVPVPGQAIACRLKFAKLVRCRGFSFGSMIDCVTGCFGRRSGRATP